MLHQFDSQFSCLSLNISQLISSAFYNEFEDIQLITQKNYDSDHTLSNILFFLINHQKFHILKAHEFNPYKIQYYNQNKKQKIFRIFVYFIMKISQEENTFQAILLPKYFNDQIIENFDQIFEIAQQQLESLQTYCGMIQSENTFEIYQGLVGLRMMISYEKENVTLESKLQIVCQLNTLKNIIHIIEYNKNQIILNEALGIIVNLSRSSSQRVDQIRENGSINCIIQKFSTGDYHDVIIEQVCLIFANVTSNSIENRNFMFKLGTLKILNNYLRRVKDFKNLKLIDLLALSISNYFRYNSKLLLLKDKQVSIQIFSKWIQQNIPIHILLRICLSFVQFLESYPTQIQIIIDFGIIPRIIELSEIENSKIFMKDIIKILNKILQSHQNHQEYLYGIGVFQYLGRLIKQYQSHDNLINILSAFDIISHSEYLSSLLLSSNELDQILSFFNLYDVLIQNKIHNIIENLIKDYDIKRMNLNQNKRIIQLSKIQIQKDCFKGKRSKKCNIVLNLCILNNILGEQYLKDERFNQFNEELLKLKDQTLQNMILQFF